MAIELMKAIEQQKALESIKMPKLERVKGRRIHIDGDYLAYYTGSPDMDPGLARKTTANFIEKMIDYSGSESAVVHLTAANSHKGERYLIASVKPYQENRGGIKPQNWAYVRDYLEAYQGDAFAKKVWATREADDGIATVAQYAVDNGTLDAIATADKDMRMLPGLHVNWQTGQIVRVEGDTFALKAGERGKEKLFGTKWFWTQMLRGDPTDSIPGLEYIWEQVAKGKDERMNRCGDSCAENYLRTVADDAEALAVIREKYTRHYRKTAEDRIVEQMGLLWLRRGRTAPIDDFRVHWGHLFDDALHDASDRLVERVTKRREEINALSE